MHDASEAERDSVRADSVRDCLDRIARTSADIDYRDFAPVSHQLATIYGRLAERGLPASTVAVAMLGATVNFYECFGLSAELPGQLRALADLMEYGGPLS
ncbi:MULTISPECIES: hypothetical protein [Novosphingobium]|jgi:hypothetical protein|uniref:hypothetical protein n=1 Tax=Novosphingobium TaxID=165696 RepID=UPI0022F25BE0|nr:MULTISPECIES: hypothetical protein [Novosphingobium]GLK45861.1 hypothetical protein GCM10017612_37810 [Novosphingobium resinovorum]